MYRRYIGPTRCQRRVNPIPSRYPPACVTLTARSTQGQRPGFLQRGAGGSNESTHNADPATQIRTLPTRAHSLRLGLPAKRRSSRMPHPQLTASVIVATTLAPCPTRRASTRVLAVACNLTAVLAVCLGNENTKRKHAIALDLAVGGRVQLCAEWPACPRCEFIDDLCLRSLGFAVTHSVTYGKSTY